MTTSKITFESIKSLNAFFNWLAQHSNIYSKEDHKRNTLIAITATIFISIPLVSNTVSETEILVMTEENISATDISALLLTWRVFISSILIIFFATVISGLAGVVYYEVKKKIDGDLIFLWFALSMLLGCFIPLALF